MLRAATLGAIDFSRFDPWNKWHWRRLHLVLDELGRQNNIAALSAQHQHWLAYVSYAKLTEESWDSSKQVAKEMLNGLLRSYFPWQAKEIGEAGTTTAREQAVSQHQEAFGKPGDPRYDQMVAELSAYFAKGKLSTYEKELERKKRRERTGQAA